VALWRWLTRRRHRDEDLQAEIASHIALATQERVAQGQDPEVARRAALKEFGNVTLTREATRRAWGGQWIERSGDLLRDVRYAVRLLLRTPVYSAIVITVLALGIGANVVVFALYNALVLSPLPAVVAPNEILVIMARTTGDARCRSRIPITVISGRRAAPTRALPQRRCRDTPWAPARASRGFSESW
jgi:hypothetical protein